MSSEYTTLVQGLETYRLADLRPYHANPRRGDVAQIARSLSRTGQYRPIVVNAGTKTGRYREVLAGNHTLAAALKLGWSHLAGSVVDVDDDTAARIVAADNRTAELGGYDDAALLALLESVAAAEQGLEGTGYSDADLLALLARMAPDAEPEALTDPDEIPDEPAEPVPGFDEVIQSWDLTFGTKSEDADYVVGQTWARRGSQVYLVDQVRDRLDYPEQVAAVESARGKWPQVSAVLIEAKANGQAVISTLSQRVPGIIPITPTDSKITRTKAISPFVAARTVHIPDPALPVNAWVAGYVEECAAFPTGTHDDQVDTTTQALSWLYQPALREQHERRRREQYGSDTTFDIG